MATGARTTSTAYGGPRYTHSSAAAAASRSHVSGLPARLTSQWRSDRARPGEAARSPHVGGSGSGESARRTVRKNIASRYEKAIAAAMVMPNWEKNSPTMPGRNEMGRNTARSESVAASTAVDTDPAPLSTASFNG